MRWRFFAYNGVMNKSFSAIVCSAALSACSSVQMMDGTEISPSAGSCNVTVYQTRAQATKRGEIEELCIINGTSSMSFSHTVATAVEKHKGKACACGASNVYIESRREAVMDVATVTMVAFRYLQNHKPVTLPASM
jgi:hypothetical protein